MKKLLRLSLCLAMLLATVTACSSDPKTDADEKGGDASAQDTSILKISSDADPVSFDPADFNSSRASLICYSSYDTLLVFSEDGTEVLPNLAESWEQVDDLTYKYKIRSDIKFSDGSDMTMDDVIFSLERIKLPETAASMSYLFEKVESFEATGDFELTVKLSEPDSTWQFVPATSPCTIVSKAAVEAAGEEYGTVNNQTVVGTGPYILDSWSSATEITLKKNENYWGDKTKQIWDSVSVSIISDTTATALAAQNGDLDYVHLNITPENYEMYESMKDMSFTTYDSTVSKYLAFNTAKAPFDDVNFRKACAYAINSAEITDAIGLGYAEKSEAFVLPKPMYYMDEAAWESADASAAKFDFDLDKAKEALAASAYPEGTTINLYTSAVNKAMAEIVQYHLAQIGVTVEITEYLNSEGYGISYGYTLDENGDRPYDMFCTGWLSDYLDPIGYLTPFWHSRNIGEGGANQAVYSNPEVDKLIDEAYKTPDDKERAALEIKAFEIAAEDVPYLPLYTTKQPYALSNKYSYTEGPAWFWNFQVTDIALAE